MTQAGKEHPRVEVANEPHDDLPAGEFSCWLRRTRNVLAGNGEADVTCGACNACCRSSQFVRIGRDETETLSRVPGELLFPAPGMRDGTVLLGYDEEGHCPMLIDDKCSIYEHRPVTCCSYDCRVFSAAGMIALEDDKAPVSRQVRRWEFAHPAKRDRDEHAAVRAAATFLQQHPDCFPAEVIPSNSTQLAVLAVKVHEVFLKHRDAARGSSDREVADAIVDARDRFDAGGG